MNKPYPRIEIKEDQSQVPHVFVDGKEVTGENAMNALKTLLLGIKDEQGRELLQGAIQRLRKSFN